MLRSRSQATCKQLVPPRSILAFRTDHTDRHRVPGNSPAVSGVPVVENDDEVTIFFHAGVSPNNEISVGLQDGAEKILRVPYFSECHVAGFGRSWMVQSSFTICPFMTGDPCTRR